MKVFTTCGLLTLCLFAHASYALDRTSTGFYYPIGTANFDSACGTWLGRDTNHRGCYFDGNYHVGVDMMTRRTDADVYAIADGEVIYIDDGEKSWGAGNCGLFIQHKKQDGRDFIAVYGHLTCSTIPSLNSNVLAGHSIGKTGQYPHGIHLHFAIHDGTWATIAKQGWGKMPNSSWPSTNTFVDPIAFIENNKPVSSACIGTTCGDAVLFRAKLSKPAWVLFGAPLVSVTDVGWWPISRSCESATQRFYLIPKYLGNDTVFRGVPAPSTICASVIQMCIR